MPVVIDAAAAFESVLADPRATIGGADHAELPGHQAFSTAEGGAVLGRDTDGIPSRNAVPARQSASAPAVGSVANSTSNADFASPIILGSYF